MAAALAFAAVAAAAYAGYETVEEPHNTFFGTTFNGIAPGKHVVALTFDDGPNGKDTEAVLDTLARLRARATFFVVGEAVVREPALVRRIAREGHAIGNHTWDHAHLNVLLRPAIDDELDRTADAVASAAGVRPRIVRPPFGARSFLVLDEIRRRGETAVLWSVPLADDWERVDAATIARRVIDRAGDGDVIVLHDGDRGRPGDRAATAAATATIVEALRARGLRFVTIPQMLALSQ